jgi:tRNA A37 threonylcarbamoyladenosine synthetase subunit TsaC/SUA5/YrdC
VAHDRVEAVRVVLDGGVELYAAQLSQAGAAHRWPKQKVAQLLEAIPRRLALVLHEGEVPCLGRPTQVVGCQPRVIRRRGLLTAEELLAMVEPIQRISRPSYVGNSSL